MNDDEKNLSYNQVVVVVVVNDEQHCIFLMIRYFQLPFHLG